MTTDTADLISQTATKDQSALSAALHGTSAFARIRTSPAVGELVKRIVADNGGLGATTAFDRMRTSPAFSELAKRIVADNGGFSASRAMAGIRASTAFAGMRTSPAVGELLKQIVADNGVLGGTTAFDRIRTSPAVGELVKQIVADIGLLGASTAFDRIRTSPAVGELIKQIVADNGGLGALSNSRESALGFSGEPDVALGHSQDHNLSKFSPEMCAAAIAVLCFAWLIAAWLDLAAAYDIELTWSNRFDLIDDLGLIIGGTIATYRASLLTLRRLMS